MARLLHLPLDFDRRETIRLLLHKLSVSEPTPSAIDHAFLYALRIWMEWGATGKQLRPLLHRFEGDPVNHPWPMENITFVLEDAARWPGSPGDLIRECLIAGFLIVADHGNGKASLQLEGFWQYNEHLSPDFRTIQERGAAASNLKRALAKVAEAATERRKVFAAQGYLPFGDEKPNEQEQDACYALFMRLYRECGLELPKAEDFDEHNMRNALAVIRKFTPDEISTVEQWILERAGEVDFVKNPSRILETFADLHARILSESISAS